MYVARIGKTGDSRMSRPCGRCTPQIAKAGIKTIVYTDDSGGYTVERW